MSATQSLCSFPRRLLHAALGLGLLASLGACAEDMYYTGAETPKRNEVRFARMSHDVRFEGASHLNVDQRQKLDAFLDRINVGYGDRLSLDMGEQAHPKRRQTLKEHLKKRGLALLDQPVVAGEAPAEGTVRLVVDRALVATPQCTPASEQVVPDRNFAEGVSYGCATTSLLGLMVADKRDLIEGKPDAPADAAVAGNAVRTGRRATGVSVGGSASPLAGSGQQ